MITDYSGPTPTGYDRFQQRVLADYSDGDHVFESELITSYMSSLDEHLPKLVDSLRDKDEKESILHSHDIKGSSSYIGAEAVRFVSGKMEAFCKDSQLSDAELLLDELKKEIGIVFKILTKYMEIWDAPKSIDLATKDVEADNGEKNKENTTTNNDNNNVESNKKEKDTTTNSSNNNNNSNNNSNHKNDTTAPLDTKNPSNDQISKENEKEQPKPIVNNDKDKQNSNIIEENSSSVNQK